MPRDPQIKYKMSKETKAEKQQDLAKPATNEKETEVIAQAIKPEPTSEKLEQLKKAKTEAMAGAAKAQMSGDEKAAENGFMEVYKIGEDIKRELAAIKQHESEMLKKEKEAAIVKLFDDAIDLLRESDKAQKGSGTMDEKNAAYHAFGAAREVIINRLLGSRPAVAKGESTPKGTKGASGQAIIDAMESGKTYDEMISEGHKDGTIRSIAWSEKFGKNPDGTYTRK